MSGVNLDSEVKIIKKLSGHDDVLIYCAGFEDRCMGLINTFSSYSFSKAFLIKYEKGIIQTPSADKNEFQISQKLQKMGEVEEITVNPLNPILGITKIFKKISNMNLKSCKISMDISVMSKFLLLIMLRSIAEYNLMNNLKIFYTTPLDYDIDFSKLAYGAGKIDVIPTFEGQHNPRSESTLLILLGYEGDRSFSLFEKLEPDDCYLGYPSPSYNTKWKKRIFKFNKEIIAAVGKDKMIPLASKNPNQTMKQLEKIINKLDPKHQKNFMISPMGTKPQTVGLFFYYWNSGFYPTIMYSHPKSHDEYSKGIQDTYLIPIPKLL